MVTDVSVLSEGVRCFQCETSRQIVPSQVTGVKQHFFLFPGGDDSGLRLVNDAIENLSINH